MQALDELRHAQTQMHAFSQYNKYFGGFHQAFHMRDYDARYRSTGSYLAAALPRNAVVLAVQQSGSARYYGGLPIVRWDLIGDDLDDILDALRALGRHPVLLVEDWEKPDFAARFARSPLAPLDWPPLALVGDTTRVLLLDPHDKAQLKYYTTGQLVVMDIAKKTVKKVGEPRMIRAVEASPDAQYFTVTSMTEPFSYLVPVSSFGSVRELWDANGKVIATLQTTPLREGATDDGGDAPADPGHDRDGH